MKKSTTARYELRRKTDEIQKKRRYNESLMVLRQDLADAIMRHWARIYSTDNTSADADIAYDKASEMLRGNY